MHTPNIIQVAIVAAGGAAKVASEIGISAESVRIWSRTHHMPQHHILRVSEMGQNIIKPEELLAYIDWARKEKK